MHQKRIALVAGVRPNFVKIAPIYSALAEYPEVFATQTVHTGQHYDYEMSQVFFEDLGLPEPDVYLKVGSGTHGEQTARTLIQFERYLFDHPTDLVVVVGDVNSTAAAALAAAKLHIPVAHVEAGLRCGDRRMPEEINRIITDCLSDIHYTHCAEAGDNLRMEGIPEQRIAFVGNVMIDTLRSFLPHTEKTTILDRLGLEVGSYAVLTLHRAENVDDAEKINRIADLLEQVSEILPLVYPIHPRAAKNLSSSVSRRHWDNIVDNANLRLIDPVGYIEFLSLQKNARVVLTDSGGIQEETTVLGIPCLTLRENTERPVTVTCGTNTVVGLHPDRVAELVRNASTLIKKSHCPPKWDGKTAKRIALHLLNYFGIRPQISDAIRDRQEMLELAAQ